MLYQIEDIDWLAESDADEQSSIAVLIDFFKQLIADFVVNQPDYPGYASDCEK